MYFVWCSLLAVNGWDTASVSVGVDQCTATRCSSSVSLITKWRCRGPTAASLWFWRVHWLTGTVRLPSSWIHVVGLCVAMHSSVGQFPNLPSSFTSWFLRLPRRATPSLWCACAPCFLTELLVCEGQLHKRSLQPSPSRSLKPSRIVFGERLLRSRHSSTCYPPSYAVSRPFVVPLQLPSQR